MKIRITKPTALLLVLFSSFVYCQQAIIPAGGNAIGSSGNSSYTVGQVVYTTATNSNFSVAQGVQQPFEISILNVDEHSHDTIQLLVYPNPTPTDLVLEINNTPLEGISYQLFDSAGKSLAKEEKITAPQTKINFEGLPSSVYYLEITTNGKLLKTFKIIKN